MKFANISFKDVIGGYERETYVYQKDWHGAPSTFDGAPQH